MGTLDSEIPEDQQDQDESPETQSQQVQPRYRYRITYSKDGPLRYTSQLDLARIWERSLRRAGLALVYSQGFNPRPKIQLAVGLPLGCASRCEIVDAWLVLPIPDQPPIIDALNAASPSGLVVTDVRPVDVHEPALQGLVWSTTYQVTFRTMPDAALLARRVGDLLAQPDLWRERRDKRVDIRPLIDSLRTIDDPDVGLEMELAASPDRGTARPDEVLLALDLDPADALIVRTAIRFRPEQSSG